MQMKEISFFTIILAWGSYLDQIFLSLINLQKLTELSNQMVGLSPVPISCLTGGSECNPGLLPIIERQQKHFDRFDRAHAE